MFGRPPRPGPQTDLQSRLRFIEEVVKKDVEAVADTVTDPTAQATIKRLAYAVVYLAGILEKHLRTGEE